MAQRYFKATVGDRIVFRGSATRVYLSVNDNPWGISFHSHARGTFPCVEITKEENAAFRAQVLARKRAKNPNYDAKHLAPSDSWVEVAS
jgi:hypothetical protein